MLEPQRFSTLDEFKDSEAAHELLTALNAARGEHQEGVTSDELFSSLQLFSAAVLAVMEKHPDKKGEWQRSEVEAGLDKAEVLLRLRLLDALPPEAPETAFPVCETVEALHATLKRHLPPNYAHLTELERSLFCGEAFGGGDYAFHFTHNVTNYPHIRMGDISDCLGLMWEFLHLEEDHMEPTSSKKRPRMPLVSTFGRFVRRHWRGKTVLDVGAGSQQYISQWAFVMGAKQYIGVDQQYWGDTVEDRQASYDPQESPLRLKDFRISRDMLDFVSRVPDDSVVVHASGIEGLYLRRDLQDEYLAALAQEIYRVTVPGSIFVEGQGCHIGQERLEQAGFKRLYGFTINNEDGISLCTRSHDDPFQERSAGYQVYLKASA